MSDDRKKGLIEKAIHAGLGNEKFLEGVSLENLEAMVKAVEERDGEIQLLKKTLKPIENRTNITTVDDLVKAGKVKVRPVGADPEEEKPEKGVKNAAKNKA